jgi:hypothetical protein
MPNTDVKLKPFAVPLRTEGRRLLGNKAVSEIYEEASRGLLELVKDGRKTLITIRSIEAYTAGWPPAKIKTYTRKARAPPTD